MFFQQVHQRYAGVLLFAIHRAGVGVDFGEAELEVRFEWLASIAFGPEFGGSIDNEDLRALEAGSAKVGPADTLASCHEPSCDRLDVGAALPGEVFALFASGIRVVQVVQEPLVACVNALGWASSGDVEYSKKICIQQ